MEKERIDSILAAFKEVQGYHQKVLEMRAAQMQYFSAGQHQKAMYLTQSKQLESLVDKKHGRIKSLISRIKATFNKEICTPDGKNQHQNPKQ